MKKICTLYMALMCYCINVFAQPTTNPTTPPARTPAQVISVYGETPYTSLTGVNFNPNWGQSGFGTATTFTVSGNEMRHYPNMNYQGIQINANLNVSSLDTLHLDVWSSNCTSLDVFLVTDGFGERLINRTLTLNSWNSLNISLGAYAALGIPLTAIKEFKFVTVTPGSGASIYVDNIYFFTTSTLPTISNFTVPSKLLGDAPFTLTAPTSNSAGAFTYISSNTNVATIAGNTVTIVGGGTTTITASQAANGIYGAGSITADLVVTVAPLATNAPTPTKPQANVISLFSNTYTNVPVAEWRTSWSGAGPLIDTAIAGNDIKKYTAVDFVGIQLTNPIDVTLADSVHISVWTPSAPAFGLKIVNTGGGPANENLVWFDGLPGTFNRPKPAQGQWNVFSLPLSLFATANGANILTVRNAIHQILFVGKAPFNNNTFYVDNFYFSSSTNILPVDFKGFDLIKSGNAAQLNWLVGSELNLKMYEVEKSTNGKDFNTVATINTVGSEKYSYTDKDLANGVTYYRIKAVSKDGQVKYSATKNVAHNSNGKLEYSIYPNPSRGELVVKNLTGSNELSLVDAAGKVVLRKSNVTNGLTVLNVSNLQNGLYMLVINNGVENKTFKVVLDK